MKNDLFIIRQDYEWHSVKSSNTSNIWIAKDKNNNPITGIGIDYSNYYKEVKFGGLAIIENGSMHSISGPATINIDGSLDYWIYGKKIGRNISKQEFEQKIKETVFK